MITSTAALLCGVLRAHGGHACAGEEQLELLARTTVLVTSIGSRSFRMAMLPDVAQVRTHACTAPLATTTHVLYRRTGR